MERFPISVSHWGCFPQPDLPPAGLLAWTGVSHWGLHRMPLPATRRPEGERLKGRYEDQPANERTGATWTGARINA